MIEATKANILTGVNNYKKNLIQKNSVPTESSGSKEDKSSDTAVKNSDSFVKSSDAKDLDQLTYSKPKADYTNEVNTLLENHAKQVEEFRKKILSMISNQGEKSNSKLFGLNLNASNDEIEAAKQSISADGEWGVNAVATRIMDMAYALSGGDSSKLDLLKNAVVDGFKAAGFNPDDRKGSKMPSITGQTYDEIMKRFDAWENGDDSDK